MSKKQTANTVWYCDRCGAQDETDHPCTPPSTWNSMHVCMVLDHKDLCHECVQALVVWFDMGKTVDQEEKD